VPVQVPLSVPVIAHSGAVGASVGRSSVRLLALGCG